MTSFLNIRLWPSCKFVLSCVGLLIFLNAPVLKGSEGPGTGKGKGKGKGKEKMTQEEEEAAEREEQQKNEEGYLGEEDRMTEETKGQPCIY